VVRPRLGGSTCVALLVWPLGMSFVNGWGRLTGDTVDAALVSLRTIRGGLAV
jgi:hypothetical protein